VHLVLSVSPPTAEQSQLGVGITSLVQYSDGVCEAVPVSLLRMYCPQVGIVDNGDSSGDMW